MKYYHVLIAQELEKYIEIAATIGWPKDGKYTIKEA